MILALLTLLFLAFCFGPVLIVKETNRLNYIIAEETAVARLLFPVPWTYHGYY